MKQTVAAFELESRAAFAKGRDSRSVGHAVVNFHRKLDEVIAMSARAHAVEAACSRGCHYCCHLPVEVQPAEALALAGWLRRNLEPRKLDPILERLRENARRTHSLGPEERKRTNLACALLAEDGTCSAYEARPAQCRGFHSTRLATCEASFADPADDTIESPEHPIVAHNAAVIIAVARKAAHDAGFDTTGGDLQVALLEALENPKSEKRFRDGKKAFVSQWRQKAREVGLQLVLIQDAAADLWSLALPIF
jgi:hypothetical protein